MGKAGRWLLMMAVLVGGLASPSLAEDDANSPQAGPAKDLDAGQSEELRHEEIQVRAQVGTAYAGAIKAIGVCIGAALAAIGGGLGVALIGGKAIESMARQPEAAGAMFTPMIIAAAMIEGGMLFAIVVCLLNSV
jgi:F-type H+-transporting ATPase subunit c